MWVEAEYEKKLHQQSSGAIFALKSIGWDDSEEAACSTVSLEVKIIESGPTPAANEKDVNL